MAGSRFHLLDIAVAAVLLTRLPLPRLPDHAFARSAKATWAYPVVGLGLGLLGAGIWYGLGWLGVPLALQAGLTLVGLIFMTGGLHEDGLADSADGIWGGHDPKRRLDIMKDSRIGSYGVLALILSIGLRWQALIIAGPLALIAAATLSRASLPLLMSYVPFARPDGLARSVGAAPRSSAITSLLIGLAALFILAGFWTGAVIAVLSFVLWLGVAAWSRTKLGGITGDTLGATQQLGDVLVLCVCAAIAA